MSILEIIIISCIFGISAILLIVMIVKAKRKKKLKQEGKLQDEEEE